MSIDLLSVTALCSFYSNDKWRYKVVGICHGKPVIRITRSLVWRLQNGCL